MRLPVSFGLGLLFGLGLVLGGMANPAKVLNFLDVFGTWDPSLAFVMGGAVVVTFVGFRLARGRGRPLFDAQFHWPTATAIDARLLAGAVIFGAGWGLVGLCPGPAFVALGTGSGGAAVFVAAMLAGIALARVINPGPGRA
jgi:hypothetical protein